MKQRGGVLKRAVYETFRMDDPQVIFTLAEVESQIAAGIIALAWGRTIIYWHGARCRSFSSTTPITCCMPSLWPGAAQTVIRCMTWGPAQAWKVWRGSRNLSALRRTTSDRTGGSRQTPRPSTRSPLPLPLPGRYGTFRLYRLRVYFTGA